MVCDYIPDNGMQRKQERAFEKAITSHPIKIIQPIFSCHNVVEKGQLCEYLYDVVWVGGEEGDVGNEVHCKKLELGNAFGDFAIRILSLE